MSAASDPRAEWLKRVLGVDTDAAQAGMKADPFVPIREARFGWLAALDTVNGQIDALAKALRDSGDADLQVIATTGLTTVTGGFRTKMMAVLADLGEADPAKVRKDGEKAAKLAERLRDQIDGDPRVAACDGNDFGVNVSIAGTLGPALDRLSTALRCAVRT